MVKFKIYYLCGKVESEVAILGVQSHLIPSQAVYACDYLLLHYSNYVLIILFKFLYSLTGFPRFPVTELLQPTLYNSNLPQMGLLNEQRLGRDIKDTIAIPMMTRPSNEVLRVLGS